MDKIKIIATLKWVYDLLREACAKLLDDWGKVNWNIWDCVKAIRARGEK